MARLLIVIALALLGSCSTTQSGKETALQPSRVISDRETLDGQAVYVRGYLKFRSHARQLWNSNSKGSGRSYLCVTLVNTNPYEPALRFFDGQVVVVEGIVRKDGNKNYIDYGACGDTVLELSSAPRRERRRPAH